MEFHPDTVGLGEQALGNAGVWRSIVLVRVRERFMRYKI